jgi:diguanylate cyclase (GGDEF)-like protein/PAS domain S-box-containing protein
MVNTEQSPARGGAAQTRPKECVLVVDDNETNRKALSRRLVRSGFEVELAESGVEALRKTGERSYDLVLLDEMMPGMSGSDVLKELRSRHSQIALPVIMVTAIADSGRLAEALDLGANDYITKPVDFTVALARIRAQVSRKRAETAGATGTDQYGPASHAAGDGLWEWDLSNNQVHYSAQWKRMAGVADGEAGNSPEQWFSRVHADDLGNLQIAIRDHLEGWSECFEHDYRLRQRDGRYRWMTSRGTALRDAEGRLVRLSGWQSDATRKKTLDELTGLPNRFLFDERLEDSLERARRDPRYGFAVYVVDLDRFRLVNDTLGRLAGDRLLVEFAGRLRSAAAETNSLVARLGEDEFSLLQEGAHNASMVVAAGDRLIAAMLPAFLLDGREFFASASVGIALSRLEYASAEAVIRDADAAMRAARSRGHGRWAIFDDSMRAGTAGRLEIETDLHTALARGEFVVYYQPRVDLHTKSILGFEALLRWKHPRRGLVPPDEFIPIAEETGMIREIGLWVLGEACEQMCRWRKQFPDKPWLDVAVNVSPVQLRDSGLVQHIARILRQTGLKPSGLHIEITENTLVGNMDEARETLMAIREMGVGLKLDDFATGYSCLRYLYRLPFDSIKIDRSFVTNLGEGNTESRALVTTILSMARSLSLGVIAEGIESKVTADLLRELGCVFGQGFHFSAAVCAEDATTLLQGRS